MSEYLARATCLLKELRSFLRHRASNGRVDFGRWNFLPNGLQSCGLYVPLHGIYKDAILSLSLCGCTISSSSIFFQCLTGKVSLLILARL
ncbi:hypothetical protein I3842_15G154600 [Carya illinoinensis]|uniref:Uncharacterized protein n=1 Tax=Carya illinoinensis TaxID=32201 RepID=A0A922A827_CARIL|nr:hypothetical protein I3842_15G154600 [Carya illinoinensis]